MKHPEHQLQRAVVELFQRVLPHDATFTAVNPLPGSSPRAGAQAKLLGLAAGIPDLLVIHQGFSLWIELKAPKGTLSDSQKEMGRKLVASYSFPNQAYTRSGSVVVCKSIDEVQRALESHRMTKAKAAA